MEVERATLEYLKAIVRQAVANLDADNGGNVECADRPGIVHILTGELDLDARKAIARDAAERPGAPAAIREFLRKAAAQSEESFEAALVAVVDALAPEVPRTREAMAKWLQKEAGI